MTGIAVRVARRRDVAADIIAVDFEPVGNTPLPAWEPGAHIDVMVDDTICRQYSLCGRRGREWTIAVQLAPQGRGGSAKLFDRAVPGAVFDVSYPRNLFALAPATSYLFIAGGIGITPIKAMVDHVSRSASPWSLWYGGRNRARMAFVDDLIARHGENVHVVTDDRAGRIPVDHVLDEHRGSVVYCCGPEPLMEAVSRAAQSRGIEFRCEHFSGAEKTSTADTSFEIRVHRTGQVLTVPPGRSIADVLATAGFDVFTSCREGVCGSCETRLVAGHAEHRDVVLTEAERQANSSLMACVSRSRGDLLVLDV